MINNEIKSSPQYLQVINVALFVSLLTIGGIASLSIKSAGVSEMENRKLAKFPTYSDSALKSGEYFRQIDMYYADNFPMRDKWIDFSAFFRSNLGFQSSEIKIYDPANDTEANEKKDTTKETIQTGPLPDDGATGEIKKRVFVFKNMLLKCLVEVQLWVNRMLM